MTHTCCGERLTNSCATFMRQIIQMCVCVLVFNEIILIHLIFKIGVDVFWRRLKVLVVSNTWTDWLIFETEFCFFSLACFSPRVSGFFFKFVLICFFVWVVPACVSYQRQEAPDVSTNELQKGAVVLRNLGEELSVPPSATVLSAQPCEVFFCDGGCRNSSEENESQMSKGWQMVDAGNLRISVLPRHSVTQCLCATGILCHSELLLI